MNESEIYAFDNIIDVIVSKYDKSYRDDLKQDLYLFLIEKLNDSVLDKVKSKNDYIFISLKNKAVELMKKEYDKNKHILSLDSCINNYESLVLDDYYDDIKTNIELVNIAKIQAICTKDEYTLIEKYYIKHIGQKKLAVEYGMTQQNISKKLKKIIKMLRNKLSS